MRTAVIVLNWRRPDDTLRCVESLLAIDRPLDVIIVDNASADGSYARILAGLNAMPARIAAGAELLLAAPGTTPPWPNAAGRVIVFADAGRNGGYASGNNVGIALAMTRPETDFIWILNNDTLVPGAATLDAYVARMAEDPTIGICGAIVTYADRPDIVQTLGGGTFDPLLGRCHPIGIGLQSAAATDIAAVESRLAYVNGASAFVRRAFIETVGPMTEDYFLYWEEIDWIRRAAGRFRLGFAPGALVLHQVGASIGTSDTGGSSPMSDYYLTRNRMIFLRRFARRSLPGALIDMGRNMFREWRKGRHANARAIGSALAGRPFRA